MRKTALLLSMLAFAAGYAPAQVGITRVQERELRELKDQKREFKDLEKNLRGMAFRFGGALGSGSYLGVGVEEIDSARAKELKLKEERGVEIRRVEEGSPAEKAGLKEHDAVLEYNGQPVEGTESFSRMVRETPLGRHVKLLISRDGNTHTLTTVIGERKGWGVGPGVRFTVPPIPPLPSIEIPRPLMVLRASRIGLETEALSGQLAEYFGVKEGVLVRSVEKDSPAEKAGLKAGDVIVKIDNDKVSRTRDVSDALRSSWEKKKVPVQVVRNKKEMTLNLELPERAGRSSGSRNVSLEPERM